MADSGREYFLLRMVLMKMELAPLYSMEEMRMRADIQDQAGIAERKGNALAGELEEARMLLDTGNKLPPKNPEKKTA